MNTKCEVCGTPTDWACSDCKLNTGVSRFVCTKKSCRDTHEHTEQCTPVAPQPTTTA